MVLSSQKPFEYPSSCMKTGVSVAHLVSYSEWPLKVLLENDRRGGHYSQLDVEVALKTLCLENDKQRMQSYAMAVMQQKQSVERGCRDWAYAMRVMLSHTNIASEQFAKQKEENDDEKHPAEMQSLYQLITEEAPPSDSQTTCTNSTLVDAEVDLPKPMPLSLFSSAPMTLPLPAAAEAEEEIVEIGRKVQNGDAVRVMSDGSLDVSVFNFKADTGFVTAVFGDPTVEVYETQFPNSCLGADGKIQPLCPLKPDDQLQN